MIERIFRSTFRQTVRTTAMKNLRTLIKTLPENHHICVTGQRGVGKTCLINNTVDQIPHISFIVMPDLTSKAILNVFSKSLEKFKLKHQHPNCVVVFEMVEHSLSHKRSNIDPVVKVLRQQFPVIVDVCQGPMSFKDSTGVVPFHVPEMSTEERDVFLQVQNISIYRHLVNNDMLHLAYDLFGGIPSLYLQRFGTDPIVVMQEQLNQAMFHADMFRIMNNAVTDNFRTKSSLHVSDVPIELFEVPIFHKVFAIVDNNVVPSTPAMRHVLKYNLTGKCPKEIEEFLKFLKF